MQQHTTKDYGTGKASAEWCGVPRWGNNLIIANLP